MPHVELSLSDDGGRDPDRPSEPASGPWAGPPPGHQAASVRHWAGAAGDAIEPCLVLDADGVIVAASRACLLLLGTPAAPDESSGLGEDPSVTFGLHIPDGWIGRGLLDVVELVDLTAAGAPLAAWEAERIPPLLALSTGSLARGLMRVRVGELARTVDVVSTPLWEGTATGTGTVGSLSFFCRI